MFGLRVQGLGLRLRGDRSLGPPAAGNESCIPASEKPQTDLYGAIKLGADLLHAAEEVARPHHVVLVVHQRAGCVLELVTLRRNFVGNVATPHTNLL